MKACPMVELTEGQMETLRNEAGGASAMCGAEEAKKAKDQVVLMFTASGSVSDYSRSDYSSLQQAVATAAGVDKSLVRIDIVAASVYITAYIDVPASTTATAVQDMLSSKIGTPALAYNALGINIVTDPSITVDAPPTPPPPPTPPASCSNPCTDSTSMASVQLTCLYWSDHWLKRPHCNGRITPYSQAVLKISRL